MTINFWDILANGDRNHQLTEHTTFFRMSEKLQNFHIPAFKEDRIHHAQLFKDPMNDHSGQVFSRPETCNVFWLWNFFVVSQKKPVKLCVMSARLRYSDCNCACNEVATFKTGNSSKFQHSRRLEFLKKWYCTFGNVIQTNNGVNRTKVCSSRRTLSVLSWAHWLELFCTSIAAEFCDIPWIQCFRVIPWRSMIELPSEWVNSLNPSLVFVRGVVKRFWAAEFKPKTKRYLT
jgi:hypothetical protein